MTAATHKLAWLAAALAVALLATALHRAPASAQEGDPPRVTYQNIEDGDTIGEPPFVVQMCFAEQINIRDLDKGGDFNFSLFSPEGVGAGLRIVFQPDALGVAVYPGEVGTPLPGQVTPAGDPDWVFSYRVSDADSPGVTEGEIRFQVDEDADPVPTETPPSCLGGDTTPGPGTPVVSLLPTTPAPGAATTEPADDETPEGTTSPTATEDDDDEDGLDEEDDDPDILLLALLTIGGAGALAVLGLIAYLVRRRVGYDPHAPGPGGPPSSDHH